MASIRKDILTSASPATVWDVIRDIGAVHTRLAPGIVTDTKLDGDARIVTFANGMVVREPIVAIDDAAMRLVWTAEGGRTAHYNSSMQVFADGAAGSRLVWISDFLPNEAAEGIGPVMQAGAAVMKQTLDRAAAQG